MQKQKDTNVPPTEKNLRVLAISLWCITIFASIFIAIVANDSGEAAKIGSLDWALDVTIRNVSSELWIIGNDSSTSLKAGHSFDGSYVNGHGTDSVAPAPIYGAGETPYDDESDVEGKMSDFIKGLDRKSLMTTIDLPNSAEVKKWEAWRLIDTPSSTIIKSFELIVDVWAYAVGSEWSSSGFRIEDHCHSMSGTYTLKFSFGMEDFDNPENWKVILEHHCTTVFERPNRRYVSGYLNPNNPGAYKRFIEKATGDGWAETESYWRR